MEHLVSQIYKVKIWLMKSKKNLSENFIVFLTVVILLSAFVTLLSIQSVSSCETMESKYVTLPSNVKSSEYDKNTTANFTTRLAMPLSLPGEWEVAITELSYTNSWFNVPRDQMINISYDGEINLNTLRAGRYESIDELVGDINKIFSTYSDKFFNWPVLLIDRRKCIVTLRHGLHNGSHAIVEFEPDLMNMLGLTKPNSFMEEINGILVQNGVRPYQIRGGLHSLYVYTNIVEPSHVGDSYVNLLRTITVDHSTEFASQIVTKFTNPYYIKVRLNAITNITIECKDDTGNVFPFEFGRTIVTLHFKRKSI